jgi:hypothetical protein
VNSEIIQKSACRMEEAADKAARAADRIENAVQRFACLFEVGYGGNGIRLLEALEKLSGEDV